MDILPGVTNKVSRTENDIILAKKGDKAAFERLIEAYENSLFRVAN